VSGAVPTRATISGLLNAGFVQKSFLDAVEHIIMPDPPGLPDRLLDVSMV